MFERKKKKVSVPTIETKQITVPTVAGIKTALASTGDEATSRTKDRLAKGVDAGKALAVPALAAVAPKLEDARDRMGEQVKPRVADARDTVVDAKETFVEETLPKLIGAVSTAVAAGSAAKHETMQRAGDAALVLKGDAVAKRKSGGKGGLLSTAFGTIGLLSIAGALAWWFTKKSAEQDDPWARPLADPYVPPTAGRDSTVPAPVTETGTSGTSTTPTTSATPGMPGTSTTATTSTTSTTSGTAVPATTAAGFTTGHDTVPTTETGLSADEAAATFTPETGQVTEVPSADHELIPPATQALPTEQFEAERKDGFGADGYRSADPYGYTREEKRDF